MEGMNLRSTIRSSSEAATASEDKEIPTDAAIAFQRDIYMLDRQDRMDREAKEEARQLAKEAREEAKDEQARKDNLAREIR